MRKNSIASKINYKKEYKWFPYNLFFKLEDVIAHILISNCLMFWCGDSKIFENQVLLFLIV